MANTKSYNPFSKAFKDEKGNWIGHNFIGIPKDWFTFKMKVYYKLPVPIGDKTFTYREYNFMSMPKQEKKFYGIDPKKIKPNNQMENCINYFISNKQQIPLIDLDKDIKKAPVKELLDCINNGLIKTKEFYKKNPPIKDQDIKVFVTTVHPIDPKKNTFRVENLTDKFFSGTIIYNDKKYALIYFPFGGKEKQIMLPFEKYKSNNNGSFNVELDETEYYTIPTINLKDIKKYEYFEIFKNLVEGKKTIRQTKTVSTNLSKPKPPLTETKKEKSDIFSCTDFVFKDVEKDIKEAEQNSQTPKMR